MNIIFNQKPKGLENISNVLPGFLPPYKTKPPKGWNHHEISLFAIPLTMCGIIYFS
jgi:hypothetical protein